MIRFNIESIQTYCGLKTYHKGCVCANFNKFIKTYVQDETIFGLYQDNVNTYRVNIVFINNIPDYTWCSCPDMSQAIDQCKHIAGLMILWNQSPQNFTILEPWHDLLKNIDQPGLLKLISTLAYQSIGIASSLYEAIKGIPLIEDDDKFDDKN